MALRRLRVHTEPFAHAGSRDIIVVPNLVPNVVPNLVPNVVPNLVWILGRILVRNVGRNDVPNEDRPGWAEPETGGRCPVRVAASYATAAVRIAGFAASHLSTAAAH